jgi:hypothetical protein
MAYCCAMLHRLSAWILYLDRFWRDLIKMLLAKVLLGALAAWIVYRFPLRRSSSRKLPRERSHRPQSLTARGRRQPDGGTVGPIRAETDPQGSVS